MCVSKHLGQAAVLFQEALQGYPQHRWLAIGHLAEAEAESQEMCPDFSARLRSERRKAEGGDYIPNCLSLIVQVDDLDAAYGCDKIASRVAGLFLASNVNDVKEVLVDKGEAAFDRLKGKKYRSVRDAEKAFGKIERPSVGYDKVYVTLTLKDGTELSFRYDHSEKDPSFTKTTKHYLRNR